MRILCRAIPLVVFTAIVLLLFSIAVFAIDPEASGTQRLNAESGSAADGPDYSTIDPPQELTGGEQRTNTAQINSPGSDSSAIVPGSSAVPFSQTGYFKLGRAFLRPFGVLSYLYESNLLNVSNVKSSDHMVFIQPGIEAFIPAATNGIRFDYTWGYRDYKNFPLRHKFSHALNADSRFEISPILSFSLRDHFARSSVDSREFVPGRELFFSDALFNRNDIEGQLDWALSGYNNLGFTAGWNKVVFDKLAPGEKVIGEDIGILQSTPPFYDYDEYRYGAFYRREVSPTTNLFVDGSYLRSSTEDWRPANPANSRGFEVVTGIESQLTPLILGQLSVGFQRNAYPGAPDQDFNGFIFRGYLVKEFSETARISVAASRRTNHSFFQNNSYYLTHGIGFVFSQELGPRLSYAIRPGYQRNSYPLPIIPGHGVPVTFPTGTEHRVDHILDVSFDAQYRFTDWIAIDCQFGAVHRGSVLPDFRFTDYRAGLSLIFGRRELNQGRIPY